MLDKVVGFIGNAITKISESENLKKIGTQVVGGVASCVAVHKVKQLLEQNDREKQPVKTKGLTEEDTKQTIGFMA